MGICDCFKKKVAVKVTKTKTPPGILVVIIGHGTLGDTGLIDQGAQAVAPLSMSEYEYNTDVAVDMAAYAKELGLSCVVLNKRDGTSRSVGETASALVTEFGLKGCVIELHFNSSDGTASGTETLYDTREKDNKLFATIVQRHMVEVFQRPSRPLKVRDEGRGGSNLKHVWVTSCLVEPLFGDNPVDAGLLKEKRVPYAKSLVDAAIEYLRGLS